MIWVISAVVVGLLEAALMGSHESLRNALARDVPVQWVCVLTSRHERTRPVAASEPEEGADPRRSFGDALD
jgi:hypothetical protein